VNDGRDDFHEIFSAKIENHEIAAACIALHPLFDGSELSVTNSCNMSLKSLAKEVITAGDGKLFPKQGDTLMMHYTVHCLT
jgi:hypothetical protein